MRCTISYIFIFLLLVTTVSAANIHGSIYSFDLEERNNTVVTVDSSPIQTIVSKDGTYVFDLEPGEYTITAIYYKDNNVEEKVSEKIDIEKEGDYILDLILFPSFDEEEYLLDETEEELVNSYFDKKINYFLIIIFTLAVLFFAIIIFLILKYNLLKGQNNNEQGESDLADEVIAFIKKEGKRVTQKDIRKNFPQSESKLSLVISELEEKQLIKKIKKGRGNIIILK